MYGLDPERTVSVLQGNPLFTNRPIAPVSLLWSFALIEIKLMIGIFSVFEVMEPQGNYMEKLYGPSEYKLTWMLVVAFLALHVYFISNMHIL